jgi:hypothetical protein
MRVEREQEQTARMEEAGTREMEEGKERRRE